MVTWTDHASLKNLLTEEERGNNRNIMNSIGAIWAIMHPCIIAMGVPQHNCQRSVDAMMTLKAKAADMAEVV
jgi:hypothetical protein